MMPLAVPVQKYSQTTGSEWDIELVFNHSLTEDLAGNSWTVVGEPLLVSGQYQGVAADTSVQCGLLNAADGLMAMGANDFTILVELTATPEQVEEYPYIISTDYSNNPPLQTGLYVYFGSWGDPLNPSDGYVEIDQIDVDTGYGYYVDGKAPNLLDGQKHTLKILRRSGTVIIFIDDVVIASDDLPGAFTSPHTAIGTVYYAYTGDPLYYGSYRGLLDNFRYKNDGPPTPPPPLPITEYRMAFNSNLNVDKYEDNTFVNTTESLFVGKYRFIGSYAVEGVGFNFVPGTSIQIAGTETLVWGTRDFTIQFVVNTSSNAFMCLIDHNDNMNVLGTGSILNVSIYNRSLQLIINNVGYNGSIQLLSYNPYRITVKRQAGVVTLYVDGVEDIVATIGASTSLRLSNGSPVSLGAVWQTNTQSEFFTGTIDQLSIVVGYADSNAPAVGATRRLSPPEVDSLDDIFRLRFTESPAVDITGRHGISYPAGVTVYPFPTDPNLLGTCAYFDGNVNSYINLSAVYLGDAYYDLMWPADFYVNVEIFLPANLTHNQAIWQSHVGVADDPQNIGLYMLSNRTLALYIGPDIVISGGPGDISIGERVRLIVERVQGSIIVGIYSASKSNGLYWVDIAENRTTFTNPARQLNVGGSAINPTDVQMYYGGIVAGFEGVITDFTLTKKQHVTTGTMLNLPLDGTLTNTASGYAQLLNIQPQLLNGHEQYAANPSGSGQCFSFDGKTAIIQTEFNRVTTGYSAFNSTLNLLYQDSSFVIEFDIAFTHTTFMTIVSLNKTANDDFIAVNNGRLFFNGGNDVNNHYISDIINDGLLHHVKCVINKSQSYIEVDGIAGSMFTSQSRMAGHSTCISIGARYDVFYGDSVEYFTGLLKNLKIIFVPYIRFITTFAGIHGTSDVIDMASRHVALLTGGCTIVDIYNAYGAWHGTSSLFLSNGSGAGTERMTVGSYAEDDFVYDGDFDISFIAFTEDTGGTERVLYSNTDFDNPILSAGQYHKFSIRYVPSTKNLRLYAGTTMLTSGTADIRTSAGKIRVQRIGLYVKMYLDTTQIGSTITNNVQWGSGFVTLGGWSTAQKARSTYFDLVQFCKGTAP